MTDNVRDARKGFEISGFVTILGVVSISLRGKWRVWMAASALMAGVCACGEARGPRLISDPDPSSKIPAIKASVQAKDFSAIRQLVKDLENDDPAVRLFSINGLQKLTGQTFGYQYFGEDDARAAAVEKWKAWLVGWEAGQRDGGKR